MTDSKYFIDISFYNQNSRKKFFEWKNLFRKKEEFLIFESVGGRIKMIKHEN
jgi:hypothetical protein